MMGSAHMYVKGSPFKLSKTKNHGSERLFQITYGFNIETV